MAAQVAACELKFVQSFLDADKPILLLSFVVFVELVGMAVLRVLSYLDFPSFLR